MRIESDGHSRGNPRLYELIENAPKTGKSPTIWAWPEIIDYLKTAGQPVPGPWPPHQEPRPDPEEDSLPVAIVEPDPASRPTNERPTNERPTNERRTNERRTNERPTNERRTNEPATNEPPTAAPEQHQGSSLRDDPYDHTH